jgi:hypothetical protein
MIFAINLMYELERVQSYVDCSSNSLISTRLVDSQYTDVNNSCFS